MKLSSYLSLSRHGIFDFRWPLPNTECVKRTTIPISLKNRCPARAGDVARFLASYGRILMEKKSASRLRQDQMHEMVRSYFQASFEKYSKALNEKGLDDWKIDELKNERDIHEDTLIQKNFIAEQYLDIDQFRQFSSLTPTQWQENEDRLLKEMSIARRNHITAMLSAAEQYDRLTRLNMRTCLPCPPQRLC